MTWADGRKVRGGTPPELVVPGIAVMHHPRRADVLPGLLSGCAPLSVTVVEDPDPGGPPSPLRTAKRAWAAVGETTHHVVIQDDAVLTSDFASSLLDVIRAKPRHAVALYVNWDAPENSFLVRRAAVLGVPWAPLSSREYTPALGLVLPSDLARELAAFLAAFPDDARDDDELIRVFCRDRGVRVIAAVPHLLDHGDLVSVTGNDFHGVRRGAVPGSATSLRVGHWLEGEQVVRRLDSAAEFDGRLDFAVSFTASCALLRFPRAGASEPHFHPFGWYWQDWCGLLGVDAGEIRAMAERAFGRPGPGPQRVAGEYGAACWLLGFDAGRRTGIGELPGQGHRNELGRAAVASWLGAGLCGGDRVLGDAEKAALVDAGLAAVRDGLLRGSGRG
ncbi:hypothetical protein ACFY12_32960 [Streptomyces sp. NPDC001339]|uniref:hypothetical protein n=1 Tax=Streptomyces sp. NPDC001339 TaxID=3364563 RepID=UPI0036B22475